MEQVQMVVLEVVAGMVPEVLVIRLAFHHHKEIMVEVVFLHQIINDLVVAAEHPLLEKITILMVLHMVVMVAMELHHQLVEPL